MSASATRSPTPPPRRLNVQMSPHGKAILSFGNWDRIQGELITFPNPAQNLPPLDRLEGFFFGHSDVYKRVVVPVLADTEQATAWSYMTGKELS